MYLVLSAFTSKPVSLLATTKNFCLFLYSVYVHFHPIYEHHQHKPEADVYHLISSHLSLLEPS